ncbi:class F sortase [Streptomyces sp. TRM75563]|uniref:class F sortase n=1 Tax=Streptomyces sp. TRM75563 TaxID=2817418 RepID=UPI001F60F5AC|nr:class F sortase [Streptomyces sp. TRM75563]MCI4042815.1 class F sortase [Streptomyces sp. TRM75563]
MKHRSPRKRWGFLAAALTVLLMFVVIATERLTDDGPADFGAPLAPRPTTTSGGPSGSTPQPSEPGSEPSLSPSRPVNASPRSLVIPRLGVEAPVDAVGVAPDGEAEVPDDARRVGWYRFGPAPGAAEGSSVIVGHVDSQTQGLGVLAELSDVEQNDRVEVRAADGTTRVYRIASRETVPKEELADSGVFRRDGPPVLTLITCTGPYLKDRGGYQANLVVTAVPESS